MQAFQAALDEAVHFLGTGELPQGFDRALLAEGGDAAEDAADGYAGSGGKPRPKPRDGKGVAKKDGARLTFCLFLFALQSITGMLERSISPGYRDVTR